MIKKIISYILTILFLLSLVGCQDQSKGAVYSFYYPRSDFGYNTLDGMFYNSIVGQETREETLHQTVAGIISNYLAGPTTQNLKNPFPAKLSLESVLIDNKTLYITVSDQLSELTGIHLMIACACLAKTGMELTNTTSVQISCRTALLDGKKSILLRNDSVIFEDMATDATYEQE